MANLKTIRADLAKLTAERERVVAAVLPADQLEAKMRAHLAELAKPIDDFIGNCAHVLNGADPYHVTPGSPHMLARAAFGLSLTPERIEALVQAAKTRAAASDAGQMRLTDTEKAERLADLATRLYLVGLEEQAALGEEQQRPDVNGAALLLIPLEVAVEHELL